MLQPLVHEPRRGTPPAKTEAGAADTAEELEPTEPPVLLEHPEPLFLPTTNTAGLTPVEILDEQE